MKMRPSKGMTRVLWCSVAGLLGLLWVGGCATVAPYERERLARRDMQLERDADANAGEEHATAYREGSSGGGSSSGGGCGCN
jgi:uncharacterized protein DUF4266